MASQVNSVVAGNYDEDIAENPFFRFLCSEHSQFFEVILLQIAVCDFVSMEDYFGK